MTDRKWVFLNKDYDKKMLRALSEKLRLSPAVCTVLLNRGITCDNAEEYFSSSPDTLYDPYLMRDMDKAVKRLKTALSRGEKICVFGDYDADGVSSTAMLSSYLRSKGAPCAAYIPKREGEGYGVNSDAIKKIAKSGASLIVTVDTGISAVSQTEEAKKLGIDVIITDHHECGKTLPDACAVLDPKRPGCPYPFKSLAGAGVCFKLICAMEGDSKKALEGYGEYVALATVADVVELLGENRALVKIGIEKIKSKEIPWIDALLDVSNIKKNALDSYSLAFMAAPRINAAGRLKSAYPALCLMQSKDREKADKTAAELDMLNAQRKKVGEKILAEAVEKAEKKKDKKVLVLSCEGWHSGVIGVIASRLSEMYYKTVVMISLSEGVGSGSARAIEGFNLYDALASCSDLLEKFGGHAGAAGLTIKEENIPLFEEMINKYADSAMTEDDLVPKIYIDCAISCESSLLKLCREQELLEPFGEGNRKGVFAVLGAKINSARKTRDNKHLMMSITKSNNSFSCIGFGMGALADTVRAGDICDIAASIEINEYMGKLSPQFHLIDVKKR